MKYRMIRVVAAMWLFAAISAPLASAQAGDAPEEMTGIKVGETAPEFKLKDQEGNELALSELLKLEGSTVLVFHRSADW